MKINEKTFQSVPGRPKASQSVPERPKASQSVPGRPRASQSVPGRPKASQGVPGRPKAYQSVSGRAKTFQNVPGRPKAVRGGYTPSRSPVAVKAPRFLPWAASPRYPWPCVRAKNRRNKFMFDPPSYIQFCILKKTLNPNRAYSGWGVGY